MARTCPVAAPAGPGVPLLVIYGSNFGSSEAFARRIAAEAAAHGYAARVGPMDAWVGRLPTQGAPHRRDGLVPGQAAGQRGRLRRLGGRSRGPARSPACAYAVLGCGDRKWARTFQAIPTRVDAALAAAGATRLRPRGEIDADRDFVTAFEQWYATLWDELDAGLAAVPQSAVLV